MDKSISDIAKSIKHILYEAENNCGRKYPLRLEKSAVFKLRDMIYQLENIADKQYYEYMAKMRFGD